MTETVLVTGATGNVGRHVVTELLAMDVDVRAMARDPEKARLSAGVEVVYGDLTEPDTLDAALDGVDAVFLLWPSFSADGAAAVVEAIARHARRVVYLSAMLDGGERPDGFWGEIEELIERSGLEWTFLRAGGFATNTLGWADQIRSEGVVRWPYGAAGRSLVHEADIAAVAARALTDARHAGAAYALTGPEVVTQADQVRVIGEVIGRPARWEELAPGEAREFLSAVWGDPGFVDKALGAWAAMVHEPEPVTTAVEEVTGVPARTFRQWASDHADDFRPPSAREIGERYVSAMGEGKFDEVMRLMSEDVVRVAPMESGGAAVELRGMDEIMANSGRLTADYDIHHVDVGDPLVGGDRFAVRFSFDETHRPSGERMTTTKMSLYTVTRGKITREEVFYYHPPHSAAVGQPA